MMNPETERAEYEAFKNVTNTLKERILEREDKRIRWEAENNPTSSLERVQDALAELEELGIELELGSPHLLHVGHHNIKRDGFKGALSHQDAQIVENVMVRHHLVPHTIVPFFVTVPHYEAILRKARMPLSWNESWDQRDLMLASIGVTRNAMPMASEYELNLSDNDDKYLFALPNPIAPPSLEQIKERFFKGTFLGNIGDALWEIKEKHPSITWNWSTPDDATDGRTKHVFFSIEGIDHWHQRDSHRERIEEGRQIIKNTMERNGTPLEEIRIVPNEDCDPFGYHGFSEWTEEEVWTRKKYDDIGNPWFVDNSDD